MATYGSTINPRGRGSDRRGKASTEQALASEILSRSDDNSRIQKSTSRTDQLWKPVEQGQVYDPQKGRNRAAQQQALMAQGAQLVSAQEAIAKDRKRAQQEGARFAQASQGNQFGGQYGAGGIETAAKAAYDAGFRGQDLVELVAVAGRESGFQPDAHRSDRPKQYGSGDRGLWQINYIWDDQLKRAGIINDWTDLFDPATNARAARYVFDHQGWDAWGYSQGSWGAGSHVTNTDRGAARSTLQALGLI